MRQLTPEQHEALMADMMFFFDNSQTGDCLEKDMNSTDEIIDRGHTCSGDMKRTR